MGARHRTPLGQNVSLAMGNFSMTDIFSQAGTTDGVRRAPCQHVDAIFLHDQQIPVIKKYKIFCRKEDSEY